MSLSDSLNDKKFDFRLVRRVVDKGFPEPEGYKDFVTKLEDDSSMAKLVELEDEISEKT